MKHPEWMDNRRLEVKEDASRYEMGCPNFPGIFGLGAAIDYHSEIGVERIEERILALTDSLIKGLDARGFEIVSPREGRHRSGIVVFKVKDPESTCRALLKQGIYVSARGEGIRVAPHFYNTEGEIGTLLKKLES